MDSRLAAWAICDRKLTNSNIIGGGEIAASDNSGAGRLEHGAVKGLGVISGVMEDRIMGPSDHLNQDQAQFMDRGEP